MGPELRYFIFFLFFQASTSSNTKRCLDIPEVNPKRFVSTTVGSNIVVIPLTLGVTDRITHRLSSNVFAIFLKEMLGYDQVEMVKAVNDSQHESINLIFKQLSGFHELPTYLINLEVWVPPDINMLHYQERDEVVEFGNISPPGRFGWFIPKKFLPENVDGTIQWNVFKNPKTAMRFMLPSQIEQDILNLATTNKLYVPEWCNRTYCPILIAENYGETSFVIGDIKSEKMYIRVAWIGVHFNKYVEKMLLINDMKSCPIFLTYSPNELTLEEEYISVMFPPCDYFSDNMNCNYENKRLVKFAWNNLKDVARPAYEALQSVDFTTEDYQQMMRSYFRKKRKTHIDDETNLYEVACEWMRNHSNILIKKWMPVDDDRDTLFIGGIFPLGKDYPAPFFTTVNGIVLSSEMAVQSINNNPKILRDYKLKLLLDNGECKSEIVLEKVINYIFSNHIKRLIGILGPACSETLDPLAAVATRLHTIIISYSAEGSSFVDRQKYPFFFRTIGENKKYKYAYLKLFQHYKWKRIASLTEDGTKYTEYISITLDLLEKNNITNVSNRKFPRDWDINLMEQRMMELSEKNARIIIADVDERAARAIMCLAYKKNMTAEQGYVWFLPNRPTNQWLKHSDEFGCTDSQMMEAINGHFSMTHAFWAPEDSLMQENITVKDWKNKYNNELKKIGSKIEDWFSDYASYAYDAVWAYAYALDAVIKKNSSAVASLHDPNTTRLFVNMLENTNFNGLSGLIQFVNGSSKFSTINLKQWLHNKSIIVGTLEPKRINGTADYMHADLQLGQIKWPRNEIPWDGETSERCFVQGFADMLNTDCHIAIIVANIIGIGILILVLIIGFLMIKHRYDKKVRLTQKYMKSLGIDLLSVGPVPSLDTWEISKEKVVINRKLGEGAFGTVYGGEAYLNEKGWVAVAVKTLKVGSTTEEKLDFLSEAEVMKRFEHKNIVQLLGVCTKNEPVYTIMEFMLYGDLKTYLLARRHLVNEKYSDDSDEISSKKLTSMALDVARALSYLAELRYVHRDVASRNCLVNAQRVVKLGDFGMTRPMFENDYYKFNRKGMLPVRWMAPESLVLGVFTPASDVWSFGVLLFEIITFGSFPFQGLTNNEVLEHVKQGNTITIPTGVAPKVEQLIRSCWDRDKKKRPQASELVETLATNPRLLVPCIDVPISSVQMDDTAQLELSLPQERQRRFSMTLRQRTPSVPSSPTNEVRLWTDVDEPLLPSPVRYQTIRNSSISEENNINIDSIL